MLDFLRQEPDAVALALLGLAVAATLAVGWALARRARRRDVTVAAGGERAQVASWPHLVRRELVAALATLILLAWWAILLELPLAPPADPSFTPSVAKAPWFFVGVQELLQYFDPWLAGVALPVGGALGLAALPYLDRGEENGHRLRAPAMIALAGVIALWLAPAVVGLYLRGEHWSFGPAWRASQEIGIPPAAARTLGEQLGLAAGGAQLLGAALCLGPFALLSLAWLRVRRGPLGRRLGLGRYLCSGALLIVLGGVAIKIALGAALGVRYLLVTPWFRI
jgi:hypothetical protein